MVASRHAFAQNWNMEIVLLGHMGRDEAVVDRLTEHKLHILGEWENPGLAWKARANGGEFHVIDSIKNIEGIADLTQAIEPDMFLTNFDDSLAVGVVDAIKEKVVDKRMHDLWIPSPDKKTAKIESDKWVLREIIDEIDPKYNPINWMVSSDKEARDALVFFEELGMEVALKPRSPTGGKGVKVMGPHLRGYSEDDPNDERPSTLEYAQQVLADSNQTGLEIQQKFDKDTCHEFTLQILTDGKVMIRPPATYDYPYRLDGDTGPGTGGMGDFSMKPGEQLPFMTDTEYNEAMDLMAQVLEKLKERGMDYKGVLYPTFFKTPEGLKIVEINSRGGDPELINIVDLMEDDVNLGEVLKLISMGELAEDDVRYKKLATAMLYLVSPDYAFRKGPIQTFNMDNDAINAHECLVRFAATVQTGENEYSTVGSSRTVGLSAQGETPWEARYKIHQAIAEGFDKPLSLHYRYDIADESYIKAMAE